eukprot:3786872-Rhodomonas_salina.1
MRVRIERSFDSSAMILSPTPPSPDAGQSTLRPSVQRAQALSWRHACVYASRKHPQGVVHFVLKPALTGSYGSGRIFMHVEAMPWCYVPVRVLMSR